jgi:hypothetical protein
MSKCFLESLSSLPYLENEPAVRTLFLQHDAINHEEKEKKIRGSTPYVAHHPQSTL